MATRPASKLNLQEFGIQDEIELVDKQARQSIENIIDDTTTASTSTWSSEKINGAIEDSSVTKTADGNPVEFSDGADAPLVKCTTAIQGNQDLHGYDKPWVGGAGKNKLDPAYRTETTNAVRFYYNNVKEFQAGTYTFSVSATATQISIYDSNNTVIGLAYGANNITVTLGESTLIWVEAYYSSAAIPSGGLSSINCQFESGSTATTYAPYSNICPITAYNQSTISVGGNTPVEIENGSFGELGENVSSTIRCRSAFIPVTAGNTYIIKQKATVSGKTAENIVFWSTHNNTSGAGTAIARDGDWEQENTVTCPSGYSYMRVSYRYSDNSNVTTDSFTDVYICDTSENTHTATYPSAIYRGSEDVVNGEVTSEWRKISITNVALYGNYGRDNAPLFYADISGGNIAPYSNTTLPIENKPISNFYTPTSASTESDMEDFEFRTNNSQTEANRFYFRDSRFTTATDFNAYLANNPIEIAFRLATPTTSSVTPTNLPIKSLFGYNHIESSTGDMEVEYITGEYQPLVDLIADNAVSDMTGATASTDGTHGLVPAPEAGDEDKFLKGDGTWGEAGGNVVYSSTPKIVGKWIDGVTDVYEVTMVTNHINPTGTDYSYFPDTFSKIISVTGSISGQVAGSSRYYAPMGGWFKQSNDNINIDCSVYLGNFGPDNVRVYYAFHDQSTITPGGMSCDEQTIVVRYLR